MDKPSLKHTGKHLLVAISAISIIEDDDESYLIELALVPLNSSYEQNKSKPIFHIFLQPPVTITGIRYKPKNTNFLILLNKVMERGFEYSEGRDLFENWFNKLNLETDAKIIPLVIDWINVRDALISYLGRINFNLYFHQYQYRDLVVASNYVMDKFDFQGFEVNPSKYTTLTKHLTEDLLKFDCNISCLKIADAYRELVSRFD